jgi:hypothetical protein
MAMPDPDGLQRADAVRLLQQMHAHPGLSPMLAWAVLLGIVGLAAWCDARSWRLRPQPRASRRQALLLGTVAAALAGPASWAYLHALLTARVVCLPGKYARSATCGDTFVDAGGLHAAHDNLLSLYSSPGAYLVEMVLLGALLVVLWRGVFAGVRAIARRREGD